MLLLLLLTIIHSMICFKELFCDKRFNYIISYYLGYPVILNI